MAERKRTPIDAAFLRQLDEQTHARMEAIREEGSDASLEEIEERTHAVTVDHMVGVHEAYFGTAAAENVRAFLEDSTNRPIRGEFRLPQAVAGTAEASEPQRKQHQTGQLIRRDDPVAMERARQEIIHPAATDAIIALRREAQRVNTNASHPAEVYLTSDW